MVDPRFQFPKKRASVPKPAVSAVGLGLGMTSAAPDRPAASAISKGEHRGSYVASLWVTSSAAGREYSSADAHL